MPDRPSPEASAAQRRAWARERTRDAAKLLPVLGLALILLPDLVLSGSDAAEGATLPWGITLLTAWLVLIVLAFWIGRAVRRQAEADDGAEGAAPPPPP
jgi:peptidoglycan/LPS O-acetylase OafA/YrhL